MASTFKYTDEQLQAIYDGDIDARNAFYFDNLDIIKRMAYCAVQKERHPTATVDDLVQGAYADMDYFCHSVNRRVTNADEIADFLRWSFHLAPYGGLAYCRENNPKLTCRRGGYYDTTYTDSNLLRLDAILDGTDKHLNNDAVTVDYHDYIADPRADFTEQSDDYTDEYVTVFGDYLNPTQRDIFARYMDGYTDTQIAEQLGITQNTVSTRRYRMRQMFGKLTAEIVNALADYDIHAENIADNAPKRFYKTSEKERERMARYLQRKRERKLAESATV